MGQSQACCGGNGSTVAGLFRNSGSPRSGTLMSTDEAGAELKPGESEGLPCWALVLLSPLFLVLSPLLILEAIILFFTGYALPPLSCGCVKTTPVQGTFDRDAMPPQQEIPADLMNKTSPITAGCACCKQQYCVANGDTAAMVKTSCELMAKANTVSTTADVPQDLSGIFWMRGNSVPEEIACLSYAVDGSTGAGVLVTRPNSYYGWTYMDSMIGKIMSVFDGNMGTAGMMYFVFTDARLTYGRVYGCDGYDYSKLSGLYQMGKWTMERLPGEGVAWKRGCYWFPAWFGNRLEAGSYDLVKIMHTNGSPLQPAYDEFVTHMDTNNKGKRLMMSCPAPTANAQAEQQPLNG